MKITRYTPLGEVELPEWSENDYCEAVKEIDRQAVGMSDESVNFIADSLSRGRHSERQKRWIYKLYVVHHIGK